ncbi:MAG: hypothetical protein HY355_06035 [Armatimonadetes bacterium]|nr:hypothetical protein [Armatimonadota bacterium]
MLLSTRNIPFEIHGTGRFVLPARDFVPAYIKTYEEGRLKAKAEEALEALRCCTLCPRNCEINRLENKFAVCKVGRYARVSSYFHHFGEEDVLRGWNGSGTIFFAWCNLRCVFCLGPDACVFTDRGVQRIEDLFASSGREIALNGGRVRFPEGLRVYTREGRLAPVAKAFSHPYRGEMVVLKPYGLPPLVLTPDHAVFAAAGAGAAIQKVPAGALTRSHVLLAPKLGSVDFDIAAPLRQHGGTFPRSGRRRSTVAVLSETAVVEGPYGETEEMFLVPIRQISRVWYEGPVYNLEVADGDHSYTACGVAVGNCQNFETSQIGEGEEVSPRDLARMMLQLQEEDCHNINFVTPEHVVPQILEALLIAVEGGLRLPLVYNTGAYDSLHSIQLMDGVVDIYMPDFKLWDRERSRRYLLAPNYPEAARQVIRAMHEQVGELKVNEDGLAVRGVLARHLVMPGMLEDTREIMRYLGGLSKDTYVNVMDQYAPAWRAKTEERFQDINRRVFRKEMEEAYNFARAAGLWRFDTRWRLMSRKAWA